ncbi:hypothetical protein GCM10027051_32740 [Niabella terrae]
MENVIQIGRIAKKILVKCLLSLATLQIFAASCYSNNAYVRKTSRTFIFSQAQLIYSLGRRDYLDKWVDRPLYLNPELDKGLRENDLMSDASFQRMRDVVVSYGLDGLAFFPQTAKRFDFFDISDRNSKKGFFMLPQFYSGGDLKSKEDLLKRALQSHTVFKIDDKIVLTSYNVDVNSNDFKQWSKDIRYLKDKYGESFYFLPAIAKPAGKGWGTWLRLYKKNQVSSKDEIQIKNYLRNWLRISDGLYFGNVAVLIDEDRNFDVDGYRNFILKLYSEVMNEEEFGNKLLALSATLGHENCTRFGFTLNSNGTLTFRQSLEASINFNPDLIIIPEWDEQNENTSLRPTVYNGLTSLRLMRFYSSVLKGEDQRPFQSEESDLPNLNISYRKILTLGEDLKFELLNIPDGTIRRNYSVIVSFLDSKGKVVFRGEKMSFTSTKLSSNLVELPTENYSSYQILKPIITIYYGNVIKEEIEKGLQPIYLNATTNWDYKWVKQNIRDILVCKISNFKIEKNLEWNNEYEVNAELDANEKLAFVELLENNQVVYSYSAEYDTTSLVVKLAWSSLNTSSLRVPLAGSITVQGINKIEPRIGNNVLGKGSLTFLENKLSFNRQGASIWPQWTYFRIPKKQALNAIFKIKLPGIYTGELSVRQLLQNEIYGIEGKGGFNLVFSLCNSEDVVPEELINKDYSKFRVKIRAKGKFPIYQLQAIGISGKMYRSNVIIPNSNSLERQKIIVYSESKRKPVVLDICKDWVPEINYQFENNSGSILKSSYSRSSWGILGGHSSLATGFGGGRAGDDSPFFNEIGNMGRLRQNDLYPEWVKSASSYYLRFNGKGEHISLPQGVIPRLSGFTVEFDIRPKQKQGNQTVLANRSGQFGSLDIGLHDGQVVLSSFTKKSGLKSFNTNVYIHPDRWQHIKIEYDLTYFEITIDGKSPAKFRVDGPGVYDVATSVGGFPDDWFSGDLKNLSIYHFLR